MKKIWIVGAALTTTMCLAAAASAASLNEPPKVDGKPLAEGTVPPEQAAAAEVGDSITRVNELLSRLRISDAASLSVTYGPDLIVLHTRLSVSSEFKTALERAASPTPLHIQRSEYSAAELDAEAQRLLGVPGVAWVGPNDDLSGLNVGLRPGVSADISSQYPVKVDPQRSDLVTASRNRDVSPAWSGALMRHKSQAVACSAGVSVSVGTRVGFTTSQHCNTGTWVAHDYTSNILGETTSIANQRADTRFVEAATSSPGRAWIGGWDSTTSRAIYRADTNPAIGQRVCTNGGITGEVCGPTYVRQAGYAIDENGIQRGPGFWVLGEKETGIYHNCIGNKGDSGSDIHNYTSSGDVEVRGLLMGVDRNFSTTYCPGMHPDYFPQPDKTSSRIFAINIVAALNSIGATPRTGG